jgi:MFS family permease
VFLINVPVAAVCVPVALRHVPESRNPHAHGRFDVLGAVLGALALALVTYALIEAPGQGASAAVIGAAVGGVLLGVAFVQVERRRANPMLPPSVFGSRQFTAVNIVTLCVYAALGGYFFLSAIQLQVVAGYSALGAGTALLPTTVLMLLFSASSGELGQRIGPRIPLTVGPLFAAAGMLLMLRVGPGDATVSAYLQHVLPAVTVLGLGLVTVVAPLTSTVLASVDTARAGLASGINNAAARAAGLIAVAALPLLAGMGPEAYRDAGQFAAAFKRAMPMCAGLMVLGSVIAWATVRTPPAVRKSKARPECTVHCAVAAPPLEPARDENGDPGRT